MNITYSDHNKEFLHVVGDRTKHTIFINKIGGRWNKKLEPPGWILNNIFKKDLDTYIKNFELKQIKKNKNKKNKVCDPGESVEAAAKDESAIINRDTDTSPRPKEALPGLKDAAAKRSPTALPRESPPLTAAAKRSPTALPRESPPSAAAAPRSLAKVVVDPIKSIANNDSDLRSVKSISNKEASQRAVKSNARGSSVKSIPNHDVDSRAAGGPKDVDLMSVKSIANKEASSESDISENYRKGRGNILGAEYGFTGNEKPPLKEEDDIFYESENGSEYENGKDTSFGGAGDYDSESKSYIKDKKGWSHIGDLIDTEKVNKRYESENESDNENDTTSLRSEYEDDRRVASTKGGYRGASDPRSTAEQRATKWSTCKAAASQSTAKPRADTRSTYKADASHSKFSDDRGAASTKGSDSLGSAVGDLLAAASVGGDSNSAYSEYKKSELLNRYNNKKKFDTSLRSPPKEASERSSSSDDDNRAYGEKRTGSTTAFGNDRFAASTFCSDRKSTASFVGGGVTSRKGDISGSKSLNPTTRGEKSTYKAAASQSTAKPRADSRSKGGDLIEAASFGCDRSAASTKVSDSRGSAACDREAAASFGGENDNKRCEKCNRKIKKKKGGDLGEAAAKGGYIRDEKEIKIDRNIIGTPPVSKFLYNGNKKKIYKSPAKSPNIFKNSNVYSYYNNNPVTKKKLYENLYKYNKGLSFPDSETEEDSEFDYESD